MKSELKCQTCGKPEHNYLVEEFLDCIPPKSVLNFGDYVIDYEYRDALFREFPMYTSEEVVGSFLGYNPHFPSQNNWLDEQKDLS